MMLDRLVDHPMVNLVCGKPLFPSRLAIEYLSEPIKLGLTRELVSS